MNSRRQLSYLHILGDPLAELGLLRDRNQEAINFATALVSDEEDKRILHDFRVWLNKREEKLLRKHHYAEWKKLQESK